MLVRPISEIKQYVKLNYTFNHGDLDPTLQRAENKFMVKYLGREQYDILVEANNTDALTEDQEKLLHYASGALYNYAILLALPGLNVQISGMGITQQHTDKSKPAFQHAVRALEESLKDAAYDWLESMLDYLEENEDDFPYWVDSDAYTRNKESFINTAARFNECYNIQYKIQTFHAIKPIIYDMECFTILPIIGQTFFDELKTEILEKNISAVNKPVINFIQKALANYTIANAIRANWVSIKDSSVTYNELVETNDNPEAVRIASAEQLKVKIEHAESMGSMYISKLLDHLTLNIDSYPSYKAFTEESEEEDSCCSSSEEAYNPRSNNCDKKGGAVYVG